MMIIILCTFLNLIKFVKVSLNLNITLNNYVGFMDISQRNVACPP